MSIYLLSATLKLNQGEWQFASTAFYLMLINHSLSNKQQPGKLL